MSQSQIVSPSYNNAMFVGTKNFNMNNLANFTNAKASGNGYEVTLGSGQVYFVHPTPKSGVIVVETDDIKSQNSCLRELRSFAQGQNSDIIALGLNQAKALDYFEEFKKDIPERKFNAYLFDDIDETTTSGRKRKVSRQKILHNMLNVGEVRDVMSTNGWSFRGASMTIDRGGTKHYGFVFIDRNPTARILVAGNPTNRGIHNDLARKLLDYL